MLGRMLSGTRETPGEVIKYNGQLWKKYRGSASFGVKMRMSLLKVKKQWLPIREQ
jgi:IMP dehydrogenase/GMP reductase